MGTSFALIENVKHSALAVLIVLALMVIIASWHRSVAFDTRGDKQFSFRDLETARTHEPQHATLVPPVGSRDPGVSSGSSDHGAGNKLRAKMDNEADVDQSIEDTQNVLKRGQQAAGQVSNIPGTTSTSPNGTSNGYGTGGFPLFIPLDGAPNSSSARLPNSSRLGDPGR